MTPVAGELTSMGCCGVAGGERGKGQTCAFRGGRVKGGVWGYGMGKRARRCIETASARSSMRAGKGVAATDKRGRGGEGCSMGVWASGGGL